MFKSVEVESKVQPLIPKSSQPVLVMEDSCSDLGKVRSILFDYVKLFRIVC